MASGAISNGSSIASICSSAIPPELGGGIVTNLEATIAAAKGLALDWLVVLQIVARDCAAVLPHRFVDPPRGFAGVEFFRSVFLQARERGG